MTPAEHKHHRHEDSEIGDEVDTAIDAGADLVRLAHKHRSLIKAAIVITSISGPSIAALLGLHYQRGSDVGRVIVEIRSDLRGLCMASQIDHPGVEVCKHHKQPEGEEAELSPTPSPTRLATGTAH